MKKFFSFILSVIMLFSCAACSLFETDLGRDFKNIIVVIGDGMGENHILNAIKQFDLDIPVFMEDQKGYINTNSLSGTTDSAAGGTALSTGHKVNNSNVAQYEGVDLERITDVAKAAKMKTGVITTDTLDGATPATFSAHAPSRDNRTAIMQSQAKSGIDLLIGRYASSYGQNSDLFTDEGYVFAQTKENLAAAKKSAKAVGVLFDIDSEYRLGCENDYQLKDIAKFAVERLENKNGFFLMIEGAYIDKHSHSNDLYDAMCETRSLIDTIAYLYEYAQDGETAIFITADHETGGLQLAETKDQLTNALYTTEEHTPTPVPLFVKNYAFDATNFGYAAGVTPENTVVFEACKAIIQGL